MTGIWFVVNLMFVAACITALFVNRSYVEAIREAASAERIRRLRGRRQLMIGLSVVLFVAMAVVFLLNMRLNG